VSIVDASIWVSYFLTFDKHHIKAFPWLEALLVAEVPLIEPTLVLPEVAAAISRRLDSASTLAALTRLRNYPNVVFFDLDENVLAPSAAKVAADLGLRGADAVYVALAHELNLPFYTMDKEIEAKAKTLIGVHLL
jgi:predicted nucleic acid-binding protein